MSPFWKKPVFLMAGFTVCLVTFCYINSPHQTSIVYSGEHPLASSSSRNLASSDGGTEKVACQFPDFDPFSPHAMKFYKEYPTTSCPKGMPTITSYNGETVKINQTLKEKKLGKQSVQCWYRSVSYQRRVDYVSGDWQGPFQDSIQVVGRPAFVEVKCENDKGKLVSRMHHYIVRKEERRREKAPDHSQKFRSDQMNVLLLGVDSLSSHLFKRAMPKTRNYLLEALNATEMRKYNKVGDNTFPNLLAISAGVYSRDLKNWTQMEGFDKVPFLWNQYKAFGFGTQYCSDRVDFDDFLKHPTDSFNMPMVRALMKDKISFNNNCFEDKIEVKMWLDLIIEFARESIFTAGRFFTVGMIKRPTHDFPNQASAVDEHYFQFFKEMNDTGLLNNTFVAFFGDHGPRMNDYRRTYYGSIEERAASVVIYVPPWFRKQYPNYYSNLNYNSDMLTTNFDIHETARSLLSFPDMKTEKNIMYPGDTGLNRAVNLFTKISPERTCADASITPHMCMCNGAVMLKKREELKKEIGDQVVKDINAILGPKSSLCTRLELKSVTSLAFLNGQVGGTAMYRIMLITNPGDAMFEATVQYTVRLYFFTSIKTLGLVSRINMYRGQSDCVQEDKVSRMYCYCKNILEKSKNTDNDVANQT